MKISLEENNSRMEMSEEGISKLKYRSIEIMHPEEQRRKSHDELGPETQRIPIHTSLDSQKERGQRNARKNI